jgi:hypothetical protein
VSYLFDPFKDNWITFTDLTSKHILEINFDINLPNHFFEGLKFDSDSLLKYRVEAATSSAKILGHKPVLCFSGGIDSQAMVQCWQEAGIDFDTAILVFNDDLNSHDVNHARMFCEKNNITPLEININVIQYLTRDHYEQAEKYRCSSPHFTTHYKMFDVLQDMGYTGICCGGTAFAKNETSWGPALSAAQLNYLEYTRINQYPIIGNFLGYDPALCWSIAILTPSNEFSWSAAVTESLVDNTHKRYLAKVEGYIRHGFNIIPQESKFTGFEKVKNYFTNQTGDGWSFEKKFRHPLEKKFGSAPAGSLKLPTSQLEILARLHSEHCISSE